MSSPAGQNRHAAVRRRPLTTTVAAALKETQTFFSTILKGNFLIPYKLQSYDDTLDATRALMASLG